MKIGILTYHFVSNFGANIQTLSTFEYFRNVGHDPVIINWIPTDLEQYYNNVVPVIQNNAFHDFALRYYTHITGVCRNSLDIAKVVEEENLEMVVVGSDAVLTYIPLLCRFHLTRKGIVFRKPCLDSDFHNAFWGDFVTYLKRPVKLAIMSGSAQNTYYAKILFNRRKFKKALERFSYISVRDIWTKLMLKSLSHGSIDATITPDPVFAFNQNVKVQFSKEYIIKRFSLEENYALMSIGHKSIGSDWKIDLETELCNKGITLYELPQANKLPNKTLSHAIEFPIDPMEWYCLIKYSKGYIGELMHPVLVSLHNSVPLYVVDTYGFAMKGEKYGINPLSSKTYQIIKRFELLNNYCNIHDTSSIATPKEVVNNIIDFEKFKCETKAKILLDEYNRMMDCILKV